MSAANAAWTSLTVMYDDSDQFSSSPVVSRDSIAGGAM